MKKFFLLLLFFVAIAANLLAQTLGIAPNGVFNEDDIEFWVGSGSNQAALVLVFNDGKFPDALVWGYRYDGNKTMQQMCQEIAEADSRFFYQEGNNGSTVNGFGVDYNENGIFALQNPNNSSIVINPQSQCIPESTNVDDYVPVEMEDRWCAGFSMTYWYLTSNGWQQPVFGWTGAVWSDFSNPGATMETAVYGSMPALNTSCPALSDGLRNVSTNQNNATIAWNPSPLATSYQVEIRNYLQDWTNATVDNTTDTFYVFTDLIANTYYNCRVRAVCEEDNESSWSSLSFQTPCEMVNELPYSENFDDYGTGTSIFPDCWSRQLVNTTASNALYVSNAQHNSGGASLYFQSPFGEAGLTAVLPPIDNSIDLSTLNVVFQMRGPQVQNGMIVGILEDVNNPNSFVGIDTMYNIVPNTWERKEVNLSSYEGNGGYIALKGFFVQSARNIYIDDLIVDYMPSCPIPGRLHVADIQTTETTITWNDIGQATGYEIELSTSPSDWSMAEVFNTSSNSYIFTDLNANTVYYCRIKSLCATDEDSRWSIVSFKTACGDISVLPYGENFDSYNDGYGITPDCWTILSNNATNNNLYVYGSNAYSNSPGNSLRFSYSSDISFMVAVMPSFEEDINSLSVSFYMRHQNSSENGLIVGIVEDMEDTASFIAVDTVFNDRSAEYMRYEISFSDYSGVGGRMALKPLWRSYNQNMYVDDVVVDLAPACSRPSGVNVTSGVSGTSVEVSWTDESDNDLWLVRYKAFGNDGYAMLETNIVPVTIDNLELQTTYEFCVSSLCANGDTVTAFQCVEYTTPCYESAINEFPWHEGFENGINCWQQTVITGNIYWQEASSANISNGTLPAPEGMKCLKLKGTQRGSRTFITSPVLDLSSLESPVLVFKHIQMKWGSDQDSLRVYYKNAPSAEPVLLVSYVDNITVWRNDTINIEENAEYFQLLFEGTIQYGYGICLDDIVIYDSNLQESCDEPVELTVSELTHNSVLLSWSGSADEYEIKFNGGETELLSSALRRYDDLLPQTEYIFEVRSICQNIVSQWVSGSFVTLSEPVVVPVVTTLSASDITETSVVLNATVVDGTEAFTARGFMYKTHDAIEWMDVEGEGSATFTATLTGLLDDTSYDFKAYVMTGERRFEGEVMTFTTLLSGLEYAKEMRNIVIYPNPTRNMVIINVGDLRKDAELVMTDTQGKVLISHKIMAGVNEVNLDLSNIAAGTYIIRIDGIKGTAVRKLIKQ